MIASITLAANSGLSRTVREVHRARWVIFTHDAWSPRGSNNVSKENLVKSEGVETGTRGAKET